MAPKIGGAKGKLRYLQRWRTQAENSNDWTMTTRGSKRVSVTGLGDKSDTFFSNTFPFCKLALHLYTVDFVLLPKKDTKKSTIAKRAGQIIMCDPKTTRAYCCTKPNWIGSSSLWNNRSRPHSLGLHI